MSYFQKDINTLQALDLPDTYLKEGDFLRVKTDGSGDVEWFDTDTGNIVIGTALVGNGTVSNPSIAFQSDTNTGIYRLGEDDFGITTGGVTRMAINGTSVEVGTLSNNLNLNINGSLSLQSVILTNNPNNYQWNTLTSDSYILDTTGGVISILLNNTGTENIGRTIRFYKNTTANLVQFFASGGVVRLSGDFGSVAANNALMTGTPLNLNRLWLFEITRDTTTSYLLNSIALHNNTNSFIEGNVFRAGDGAQGTPSYSFSNSQGTDTGMYYNGSGGVDRVVFSVNNFLNLQLRDNDRTTSYRTLEIDRTGGSSAGNPSLYLTDATTGLFRPTTNQIAISNGGQQNTNFTTSGVDIGLTTLNNTLLKTLTQNGASNFNSFAVSYSSFLLPQTAIGTINQALSGCDFDGTNYVVSVAGTGAGNRLFVSTNLSTWTAITDTQISLGNSQVQFGNAIWCYISRTSGTQQLWTSTAPATTWTQIGTVAPWTTPRQVNRLKFINGQFIGLCNNSYIRFSSNGTTWTEYTANATFYSFNDITYSPELQRYVIVTGSNAILYFSGNTITNTSTFTVVSTNAENANCCSYSPKYGLFLYHGNTNSQRYYISKDGINWTFYTNPTTVTNTNNTIWINDFGGFFLDMQFNQSQVAVSRDGLSFQVIASNLTMTTVNAVYNSTGKVLLIVGSSGSWGTFRNMLTDFNNYVDSDNIYNTFNSNIRFADTIQYQNQVITTATGNNHFTISSFTRSEVVFDTNSANANIYLQGASFNGRVGCKFKFIKSNSNNNIRLHGYETTTLISPTGNVSSFNAQSIPQIYNIIPNSYFGSFELTRISDISNGVWIVDNVDVYDSSGTVRQIGNLNIAGNLTVNGTIINPIEDIRDITWPAPATSFDIDNTNIETLGKYNYFISAGNDPIIDLDNLNVSAYNNLTFNFVRHPSATTTGNYVIRNAMGGSNLVLVYCNGTMNTLTSVSPLDVITIDKDQWCRCTYKHNWISGNNYWVVHQYNSNV